MASLAVVPAPSAAGVTFYSLEEHLMALAETAEPVPGGQELEYQQEFADALKAAVEKRDKVGQFLAYAESQIALAKAEIARPQERKQAYGRVAHPVEQYVIKTIEKLGPDAKGKYPKLEGKTVTFSLRACPVSVEVKNETLVPLQFKIITITMPALTWENLLDGLDLEVRQAVLDAIAKPNSAVSKTAIKAAFDANEALPGADLIIGKHSLRRA